LTEKGGVAEKKRAHMLVPTGTSYSWGGGSSTKNLRQCETGQEHEVPAGLFIYVIVKTAGGRKASGVVLSGRGAVMQNRGGQTGPQGAGQS